MLIRQKQSSSADRGNMCVMFLFAFSEVGSSFQASIEQETHDLYRELVTGRLSQSQGTNLYMKEVQEILC